MSTGGDVMNALITANNLHVIRQGRDILHDVSLTIDAGDFITIIGPNGAGKSTLLQCLMGFFAPDGGSVVRSNDVHIGYVPQRITIEPTIPMRVERFLNLQYKRNQSMMHDIIEEASITHLLDHSLQSLSGGELQRVLLARALMGNPNLLILDEPAQNLDISSQMSFYKLLDHVYTHRTISILMVSHDLHMVMASTRRVVCLYHHICCSGEPHMVAKDPQFAALFGDDIARMMAVYHHAHEHSHSNEHLHHEGCSHG
jgi:zinc transport system ATP-binding protein